MQLLVVVRRNANAIFRKGWDSMSTVKEKELKRGNQKEKKNLKQLFL